VLAEESYLVPGEDDLIRNICTNVQRSPSPRQFGTTILHELIHSQQRGVLHGPRFQEALRSATDLFFGSADAPAPAPFMSGTMGWSESAARPIPWTGARFRPGGLDPTLEYRG
jgi:hypothetical protein